VAAYGERQIKALLADPAIVRNRLEIASSIDRSRRLRIGSRRACR
jgi:3-methyladenine DNA glycosylase Tag